MMKIKLLKPLLESILIKIQPFLEKKDTTQITSHLLIKVENGLCTFKGTDNEVGIQLSTRSVTIEKDGV